MKRIDLYFDFASPYSYLAFCETASLTQGVQAAITYRPIVLGALLKQQQRQGPLEMPAKRAWIYGHVLWLAHSRGIPMTMPAGHPFNPLPLLRLAIACGHRGAVDREICAMLFSRAWRSGADAADAAAIASLRETLRSARDPDSEAVKTELKVATQAAIDRGVFGVPTFAVDGELFWGFDAMPMLRAYLQDDSWFVGRSWARAKTVPWAVARRGVTTEESKERA